MITKSIKRFVSHKDGPFSHAGPVIKFVKHNKFGEERAQPQPQPTRGIDKQPYEFGKIILKG